MFSSFHSKCIAQTPEMRRWKLRLSTAQAPQNGGRCIFATDANILRRSRAQSGLVLVGIEVPTKRRRQCTPYESSATIPRRSEVTFKLYAYFNLKLDFLCLNLMIGIRASPIALKLYFRSDFRGFYKKIVNFGFDESLPLTNMLFSWSFYSPILILRLWVLIFLLSVCVCVCFFFFLSLFKFLKMAGMGFIFGPNSARFFKIFYISCRKFWYKKGILKSPKFSEMGLEITKSFLRFLQKWIFVFFWWYSAYRMLKFGHRKCFMTGSGLGPFRLQIRVAGGQGWPNTTCLFPLMENDMSVG